MGEEQSSQSMVLGQVDIHMQNNDDEPPPHSIYEYECTIG